jgi:glutamate---cysteine ligase / carboxylate-amine ligase
MEEAPTQPPAAPELGSSLPAWAEWAGEHEVGKYSLGVEEEVMLVEPGSWQLAYRIEDVLAAAGSEVASRLHSETHRSAVELQTGVHGEVGAAVDELAGLRLVLGDTLERLGMRAAGSGTHPTAVWHDVEVSRDERYRDIYASMRELARREPTFALHVHVGIPDPETAIKVMNGLRAWLPVLLALSANSPYWQGRDSGLASSRTPVFQAFPRVGIPREFSDYAGYVEAVDLLIRAEAIPEPTYLWWDVRPQPKLGTVEVRIMDTQTSLWQTRALVALVQCLARQEGEGMQSSPHAIHAFEALAENRFLAARDGVEARLIQPGEVRRVRVADLARELVGACLPHARALGCVQELKSVNDLCRRNGSTNQLAISRRVRELPKLVEALSDEFRDIDAPGAETS